MPKLEHVRFLLSDLIRAVEKMVDSRPTAPEALAIYWNWAGSRGWGLVAMTCQMDTRSTLVDMEKGEMRQEEFWNVVWRGEDTTGTCDLVEEARAGGSL